MRISRPTRNGYTRLSIVPTTKIPQQTRIVALLQLPVAAKIAAVGAHTRKEPKLGTRDNRNITVPQSNAPGKPRNQNIKPPGSLA